MIFFKLSSKTYTYPITWHSPPWIFAWSGVESFSRVWLFATPLPFSQIIPPSPSPRSYQIKIINKETEVIFKITTAKEILELESTETKIKYSVKGAQQ